MTPSYSNTIETQDVIVSICQREETIQKRKQMEEEARLNKR